MSALLRKLIEAEGLTSRELNDRSYMIEKIELWWYNELITEEEFQTLNKELSL